MSKYAEYKRKWYLKKKKQLGKVCVECGRAKSPQGKRCGSCAAKRRVKENPQTAPPDRTGKQKHLYSNKFRVGFKPPHAGRHFYQIRGEKHPNWKGGVTAEHEKARKSLEYKLWRKAVFERDNYICQRCDKRGGYLQVDHINEWADFPELRYEISNGQTLCLGCHKEKTKYYMKGNKNAKQKT
jgi:hypothetical protein